LLIVTVTSEDDSEAASEPPHDELMIYEGDSHRRVYDN